MVTPVRDSITSPVTPKHSANNPQARFRAESLGLLVVACLFVVFSQQGTWFSALDRLIYDATLSRLAAPAREDIVLVSISDDSLHQFGPWPWRRSQQAQLLQAIESFNPRLIALDIVYAGETDDDIELVNAAAGVDHLALPVMIDSLGQRRQHIEVLPFADLLEQADLLGHVHMEMDDDAIVRGTYLYQGVQQAFWPHLMVEVARHLGSVNLPSCQNNMDDEEPQNLLSLSKCQYIRIPFAGPPSTYPQIPANLLLQQSVQDNQALSQALQDKVVLVGLTAIGAGDWVTSPTGGEAGPMSGVEFNANLLSALTLNTIITTPPAWILNLLSVLFVSLCSLSLPRLRPTQMLITTFALALTPIVVTISLLSSIWLYLPLANAIIAVIIIYPVWSWRRHVIAWSFIEDELDRIDLEERNWKARNFSSNIPQDVATHLQRLENLLGTRILSNPETNQYSVVRDTPLSRAEQALFQDITHNLTSSEDTTTLPGERLAAQIERLESRAKGVREGREIGLAGLGHMTNGALIISAIGEIQFANEAAMKLLNLATPVNNDISTTLAQIQPPLGLSWNGIQHSVVLENKSVVFEGHTANQTPVLVAAEPLGTAQDSPYAPFWVLTLSDLVEIRQAQAQREEALAFLSHDIRSPLTSVLALIKQAEQTDIAGTHDTPITKLLEDITRYTQKGLSVSDQFLQLSRLQLHGHFEVYELELEQVLRNAVEHVFFLAKEKNIQITPHGLLEPQALENSAYHDGIWMQGNGELLERTFVNLLGNAIKYSNPDTLIQISLITTGQTAEITFIDHGHGIPADEVDKVFDPYFRSAKREIASNRGAGLGLRFVKTVVDRHAGVILVNSEWGVGTTFIVRLPILELPS